MNELIRQLQDGDISAGPVVVSIVAPRLMGYVQLIAPDLSPADQEFVVEGAIEAAIRRIDRFDATKGTFPGWARTFVRHGVADWRRAHPSGAVVPLDETLALQSSVVDEEENAARPEVVAMAALVLTTSDADQVLLRLRFSEGLTHAQIASRLDVSETACRKRLERAVRRLRTRAESDPVFVRLTEKET